MQNSYKPMVQLGLNLPLRFIEPLDFCHLITRKAMNHNKKNRSTNAPLQLSNRAYLLNSMDVN